LEAGLICSLLDEDPGRLELRVARVAQRMRHHGRQDDDDDERPAQPDRSGLAPARDHLIDHVPACPPLARMAEGEKCQEESTEHGELTQEVGREEAQVEADRSVGQRPPGSAVGGLSQVEGVVAQHRD
jgi:hypothetical protein